MPIAGNNQVSLGGFCRAENHVVTPIGYSPRDHISSDRIDDLFVFRDDPLRASTSTSERCGKLAAGHNLGELGKQRPARYYVDPAYSRIIKEKLRFTSPC